MDHQLCNDVESDSHCTRATHLRIDRRFFRLFTSVDVPCRHSGSRCVQPSAQFGTLSWRGRRVSSSSRELLLDSAERRAQVLAQVRVASMNALSALDQGAGLSALALR